MAKKTSLRYRKLAPKLRMVCNGDEVVNTLRSEQAAAVAVTDDALLEVPRHRGAQDRPVARQEIKQAKRGKLRGRVPSGVAASVFIELVEGTERLPREIGAVARRTRRKGNLVTAEVPLSEIAGLLDHSQVSSIELGERVAYAPPIETRTGVRGPRPSDRRVSSRARHQGGEGVLIGIVDVGGFDFAHPDFLASDGSTRFHSIWDQGGSNRSAPREFGYGSELTRKRLNEAIKRAPQFGVAPHLLEPQSQTSVSSHGTHVASIAGGNRGLCPKATLAGVLISLPAGDLDRRKSFYDSTRIAHAVEYLFALGDELKMPVSVNISLGTNGHAHDASSAVSRWIDYALATPGRSVCVAAGNAGQEAPQKPGDLGFIMGRIHTSGRIASAGLTENIEWIVVGNGIADLSENEFEIWYEPQDRFAIQLKPPGLPWIGPVEPGQFVENQMLADGTFVSIYNEHYAPANGHNHIACYLSPFLSRQGVSGVRAGTWLVRLIGREVRDGRYHGWIERDDPRRLGSLGQQQAWSFPSFFSARSNVDNSSVSSLACGHRVISVANLDDAEEKINVTSSQGPTRDRRQKPEIAAPGTDIVAANGFASPDERWVSMTGTSMASPYVAGVAGLMLAVQRRLTAAQIGGIIRRTARPLPGADFQWRDDAGFGRIDPSGSVDEAAAIDEREDLTS